ncbi:WD40 repeat protein [Kribbella amoyensis]|uniref:WD40 repeat protein n=1 Tax=Kribbella amoyensis TaxID=996641 RepID=A0A561BWG5_9ACTN|nr:PD40 domain-containing protein [Kribbella amoyensis]TWD83092.1 WD40 repeat protein [Kribbella amoyensis]
MRGRTRLTAALIAGLAIIGTAPATAATAALPKNGDVVFVSNGSLLAIQAGSTGTRTVLPSDGIRPKHSPDGRRLAFVRPEQNPGNPQQVDGIYLRTLATGAEQRIYQYPWTSNKHALAWSPDAGSLVVSDGAKLDRITLATGAVSTIWTAPAGTVVDAPAWSPDGSRIAFSTGNTIKLVHPDGSNLRTLTASPAGVLNNYPDWSPDSQKIAFVTNRYRGSYRSELVTLPRSGAGEPYRVSFRAYPNGIFFNGVAWSPDGLKIAAMQFNRDALPDEVDSDERFKVRAYLPDGSYSYTLVGPIVGDDGPEGLDWAPRVS